jgi:hypothetical protein
MGGGVKRIIIVPVAGDSPVAQKIAIFTNKSQIFSIVGSAISCDNEALWNLKVTATGRRWPIPGGF